MTSAHLSRVVLHAGVIASACFLGGCSSIDLPGFGSSEPDDPAPERNGRALDVAVGQGAWRTEIIGQQTIEGVGAAQGLTMHDGLVYIYGDGATGVIREYELIDYPSTSLEPTGRVVRLTRDGQDWIPHPTGLAIHPSLGVWMGDTVRQQGVLHQLDWAQMWADGNLDNAVVHTAVDDLAVNGCRPEWVRSGRGWALATSDDGAEENAIRLYDARRLARSPRTSARGVLIAEFPSGPFVQTLEWLDATDELVQVQNITEGLGYRLTTSTLNGRALGAAAPVDMPEPTDELEGFIWVAGEPEESGVGIMVSASARDNVTFVRLVRTGRRGG